MANTGGVLDFIACTAAVYYTLGNVSEIAQNYAVAYVIGVVDAIIVFVIEMISSSPYKPLRLVLALLFLSMWVITEVVPFEPTQELAVMTLADFFIVSLLAVVGTTNKRDAAAQALVVAYVFAYLVIWLNVDKDVNNALVQTFRILIAAGVGIAIVAFNIGRV